MYEANRDQNTAVVNTLEAPIKARFIRLEPQAWYGHISMRMELYGCSLKSGILCLFFYYDVICKAFSSSLHVKVEFLPFTVRRNDVFNLAINYLYVGLSSRT